MLSRSKSVPSRSTRAVWFPVFSLRVVGYILVLLAILDAIVSLVPPEFMNPNWEFATIGQFVERSPVSLIGLALVFHRGKHLRGRLEQPLLKPLCGLAIVVGCLYCLSVPLTLGDGVRLQQQAEVQAEQARVQQLAKLKTLKASLGKASPEQLQSVAKGLEAQEVPSLPTTEANLRAELLSRIDAAKDAALGQSAESTRKAQFELRKTVVKWVMGAVLAGIGFIYLGYVSWKFM
jgi:transcriptional antiterminator Rof (Rho-off)